MHPMVGGERVNDLIFTVEFADGAEFAKFHEAFLAAPERERMLAPITGADAPVEHVSSLILNEVTTIARAEPGSRAHGIRVREMWVAQSR